VLEQLNTELTEVDASITALRTRRAMIIHQIYRVSVDRGTQNMGTTSYIPHTPY
jgi:hypothetical protein